MSLPKLLPASRGIMKPDDWDWRDLDCPYLITFPRTGSHQLMHLLELCLYCPCYPKAYYYKNAHPWGIHKHDIDLNINDVAQSFEIKHPSKIVYIARNPIDVVYSVLKFHSSDYKENRWFTNSGLADRYIINKKNAIRIAKQYAIHKHYWLRENTCVVKYEYINNKNMDVQVAQLETVCSFLGYDFNEDIAIEAIKFVTKNRVKSSVTDIRVIPIDRNYDKDREDFRNQYGQDILEVYRSQ